MKSVKKNLFYNIVYQLLMFIFPLITVPYISRTLGTEGVGIYSYTYSIVSYFMLITLLGINNHGNRAIAKARDDKEKLSKTFFSIYTIQLISGLLMVFLYLLYMLFINERYVSVAWIQLIYIISATFDINWFFFGLEEFKVTITRSSIVKILSLILIFIFVKDSNDLLIYTLIMSISTLVSQLLLLPFLVKRIKLVSISINDIKNNIKPVIVLFIPIIAVSVYRVMDKTMLGILSNISEVGYYEQAEKIINVPIALIAALGTVMMPRISNLIVKEKADEILKYIEKSIEFIMFMAFPMCLGIISIADEFVPLFLGSSFESSIILVKYMSITILFLAFANVLRTQYLIPYEKDNIYVISIVSGAILNLICNLIFIPKYASIGAMIGTIVAEFTVMFIQIWKLRKELTIINYLKSISKYFIKALIMFACCLSIKYLNLSSIYTLITQILIGIVIYALLNIKYIKEIIPLKRKVIS